MKNRIIKENTGKCRRVMALSVFFLSLFFAAVPASAAIQVMLPDGSGGVDCQDLIAGQNIDAGDICMEVVGSDLVVTYTTTGGWELLETHLWVGEALADMPQTKKGNPKIGNFPYSSGDITGATSHSFNVSLANFGTEAELCADDKFLYLAVHASVRKSDGSGGYQYETAWGSGHNILERGSWAMYFTIQFTCEDTPPPPEANCETAFAFGDQPLNGILDVVNGGFITERWGWQVSISSGESLVRRIYAGAGQNDITKGTDVGYLSVSYDGNTVNVSFNMDEGFTMDETHLYVGTSNIQTAAPGQFGHLNEDLNGAAYDSYSVSISGSTVYIVAHAVVCSPDF